MISNAKSWNENWKEVRPLGGGGQGTTKVVVHKSESPSVEKVLKILNRQNDPERRRRMHREAVALRTLSHKGIPKHFEDNTAHFDDEAYKLYLICEFVAGIDLEKRIRPDETSRTPLLLQDAVALLRALLDVVAYCHSEGCGHRDIKPDNIILRFNAVNDPVLIDFGQTFNEREETGETGSEQQMGNRFLALPELQAKGVKREPRSDLTSLVGVLFFALSGEYPRVLADQKSRMPHQRPEAATIFTALSPPKQTALRHIFDRGFDGHIDRRFQSAEDLDAQLLALSEIGDEMSDDIEERMKNHLKEQQSSPAIERARSARDTLQKSYIDVTSALDSAVQELGGRGTVKPEESHARPDLERQELDVGLRMWNALAPKHCFSTLIFARITGSELLYVGSVVRGEEISITRIPLETYLDKNFNHSGVRNEIKNYLLKGYLDSRPKD